MPLLVSGGGTAGLMAGLAGMGIGPGDEMIVPGYIYNRRRRWWIRLWGLEGAIREVRLYDYKHSAVQVMKAASF